ncbi:MAG: phosphatase PAP2 family protein [Blastocatellia bacterium]
MRRWQWVAWAAASALTAPLAVAATPRPYFPGDVPVTLFIQSLAAGAAWAEAVTKTAQPPAGYVLLGITAIASWLMGGWRGALMSLISFAGMWLAGYWLNPRIARPRPPASLVYVSRPLSGYSFPSIFALTYASSVGYLAMLALRTLRGRVRLAVVSACCLLLLAGGSARVALGAHWPSDVLTSYLIGFCWAALLVSFLPRPGPAAIPNERSGASQSRGK